MRKLIVILFIRTLFFAPASYKAMPVELVFWGHQIEEVPDTSNTNIKHPIRYQP
jgi:hypothetical protein